MKRLRKLTVDMKKILAKNDLNPNDFGLVTQDTKYFTVRHIRTGEQMTLQK